MPADDTFNLGGGLRTGTFADGAVWLPNVERGTITRIDAATRTVIDVYSVDPGFEGPPAIADRGLWVAHPDKGTVSRIDITTGQVSHVIEVGNAPTTPTEVDGAIWINDGSDGAITRITLP